MTCDAKIRPFPDDYEVPCDRDHENVDNHTEHHGVIKDYAQPGSITQLVWMEGDRRTFRGSWAPCELPPGFCMLPGGHPGRCFPGLMDNGQDQ